MCVIAKLPGVLKCQIRVLYHALFLCILFSGDITKNLTIGHRHFTQDEAFDKSVGYELLDVAHLFNA